LTIFILFGPVSVMAGYFLQTGIFPDLASFMASLPFGLFTAAILYANEVPDFADDLQAGKRNLANAFVRERAYLGYGLIVVLGFVLIVSNVVFGYVSAWALLALLAIPLALRVAMVLKNYSSDKMRLVESSKLSIAIQTLVSVILIGSLY